MEAGKADVGRVKLLVPPGKEAPPRPAAFGPALLARVVTAVTGFADGYDMGVFSGVLVLLRRDFELTPQELGVVVGALYFAMAFGAPLGGMLADSLGRKKGLAATYAALIIGCLVMALATGFKQLLLGRAILGAAIGSGFCVVTTYMAEVAPKDHRGRFVCLEELFIIIGITTGYAMNYLLAEVPGDWRWMLLLGAVPAVAALLLLTLPQLPESPRWLMLQGRVGSASNALVAMVGDEEAKQMLAEWQEQKPAPWGDVLCPSGSWRRRAVLAGIGILVLSMLTGINMVSVYIGLCFAEDLPDNNAFLLTALMGCLRVVVLAVAIFSMLDRWGRRPLLLISVGGVALSLAALAYLYHAKARLMPLRFLAFLAYLVSYSVGMGPVPWAYASEVFPTSIRSKGMALGTFLARICSGVLTLIFPIARSTVGESGIFAALAVVNVGSLAFVVLFAPETMGESLEEMHRLFRSPEAPEASPPEAPEDSPPASDRAARFG